MKLGGNQKLNTYLTQNRLKKQINEQLDYQSEEIRKKLQEYIANQNKLVKFSLFIRQVLQELKSEASDKQVISGKSEECRSD